jgi:hypothetical protein
MGAPVRLTCGVVWAALCLMPARPCPACQIPVFRYALERWPADAFRIEVAAPESPAAAERSAIVRLEDGAAINGGPFNYAVTRLPAAAESSPVTILPPRGTIPVWTGSLAEAEAVVAAGPPHRELVRRLLAGDAVVWLVLAGTDGAAGRARDLLERELPALANDTVLPRGIGLPGSELLSEVPLEVRFSVLMVGPDEAAAGLLRRTLEARLATGEAADETDPREATLVVPVFGRGRAARVLRGATLDADAVADVTAFLCGACSCQAKQLAPGFDLLLPAAWDESLFGGAPPPSPASPVRSAPAYVPIPGGAPPGRRP